LTPHPSREERVSVAIAGATGLAGGELVRLLIGHPHVRIAALAGSPGSPERAAADVHPALWGRTDLVSRPLDPASPPEAEILVLATPDDVSARAAGAALDRGGRVLDLSGAFRLKDPSTFLEWYGYEHPAPRLLDSAVYGLAGTTDPREVRRARLVANPGCYPTAALTALLPLAAAGAIDPAGTLVVDAKSGVSGAGRKVAPEYLYGEVAENCRPYGLPRHRHHPEIAAGLADGLGDNLVFIPHLLPAERGLLATCTARLASGWTPADARAEIERAWRDDPFVRVLADGSLPSLRHANGTPLAVVGLAATPSSRHVVVACAIDNLLKGAASQAVENLNLMIGADRREGLL
jgi:N-acetyl-gamma-glutamyl-phosphate reductase